MVQPLAQLAQLLDDGVNRRRALAAEQEARMKDDELGARGLRDACGVVEHPDGHVELLAALCVPHEARDRGVDGEDDVRVACELAEPLRPRIVHPELALEVDLAGREAALPEELHRLFGALPRGDPSRAVMELSHGANGTPSDPLRTLAAWSISRHVSICSSSTSTSA